MTGYQSELADPRYIFWGYQVVGLCFIALYFLTAALRFALRLRILFLHDLEQPTSGLLFFVLVFLTCSLFGIIKIRYRKPVWRSLGWTLPSWRYIHLAALLGVLLGLGVSVPSPLPSREISLIPIWTFVLLSTTLGPFLEESFFRGCVLPLVARSAGTILAILATAILFSVFHQPRSLREWLWIVMTGGAYGWIPINSRSQAASALMHMAYNLTLYASLKI